MNPQDTDRMWQLLVLNGPCGVGKSQVAEAISAVCKHAGHTVIELDALAWVYPRTGADPYGTAFALDQLGALRPGLEARGVWRAILPYVVESSQEMGDIANAFGGAEVTHVRLRAKVDTLAERLAGRERGSGLAWHKERAALLAHSLESSAPKADLLLDTDMRSPESLAGQIVTQTRWTQ